MAQYLVQDDSLTSVANAIRAKGGTSSELSFPSGFVSAINSLSAGAVARDYLYKAGEERFRLSYGTNASNSGSEISIVGSSSDLGNQVFTYTTYNITTNTKYLTVDINSISGSGTALVLGIATSSSNIRYFSQLTRNVSRYGAGTLQMDVSDITGEYYVMIAAYGGTGTCTVTNWYFEEEV